nr:hypothetical protein [uncultured Psychroserpens sp.]
MKDRLITYLTFGNRFYSIEQTQSNGEAIYYGIELKKTKNQVEVAKSFEYKNLDETSKYIPKHKPVFLVINNEFVITKRIESNETEPLKLAHLAFQNIKIDDFYYEVLKQKNIHFISICRKDYLDKLLSDYQTNNISIIDFSLGNLMITSISNLISEKEVQTSNAVITKENDQISAIEIDNNLTEVSYAFNDTTLKSQELLPFSSALSLITKTKQVVSAFNSKDQNLLTNFKEKLFFNQFIKIGLSLLFITLLINFFLFNNYYDKVNQLREITQVFNVSKSKLINLSDKVQKTQKMVEDVLKSNASKSSFYVDAIIHNLPDAIILSELNYQPLLKKIKDDKAIQNDIDVIIVSGTTSDRVLVSQWISQLETKDWINNIEILSFDDKQKASLFSIKINIQDDTKN